MSEGRRRQFVYACKKASIWLQCTWTQISLQQTHTCINTHPNTHRAQKRLSPPNGCVPTLYTVSPLQILHFAHFRPNKCIQFWWFKVRLHLEITILSEYKKENSFFEINNVSKVGFNGTLVFWLCHFCLVYLSV